MTSACVAQIADPDKPGRLYGCDRGTHAGHHHTVNDRGEDITWGDVARGRQAPRPSEALTDAYLEHTRAVRAHDADPTDETSARVAAAVQAVTREESTYTADCIAAGWPAPFKPTPLFGPAS